MRISDWSSDVCSSDLAHVVRHEAVYGSLNRISSVFALRIVLAEHIEQSVRIILREGFVVPPDTGPEAAQLYAAFIAHGAVGAVEAWLHLPAPRDERLLLASIEAMHPSWYAPMRAIQSPIRDRKSTRLNSSH